MTDPVRVVAEALLSFAVTSRTSPNDDRWYGIAAERVVAALKAAGALMPEEFTEAPVDPEALLHAMRTVSHDQLDTHYEAAMFEAEVERLTALLQEVQEVLGLHECGFGVRFWMPMEIPAPPGVQDA